VPINTRFTPAEVKFVVANAGAKLLFTNDGLVASTNTVERCEVIRVETMAPLYADGSTIVTADTAPDDAAFICYTSGTTGDPKGAVLTHGSFNAGSQSWAQALDLWPGDKLQLPFPLAFTGGLALWLYTYWSGGSLLLDNEVNIDRIYDNFEKERATGFMGVPTIFQMIVDHPRWKTADLSTWKKACSGGAVVPPSLLKAVQARGVPMLQMFSLTEASAAGTVLPARDAFRKVGSAGIPIVHGSLKIADDNDNEVPVGEVGEILLAGPQIMAGYWNNPDATAAALRGGWLHTATPRWPLARQRSSSAHAAAGSCRGTWQKGRRRSGASAASSSARSLKILLTTSAWPAGRPYSKNTGVGETTCAATPSASMSASRVSALHAESVMRRNSASPSIIIASRSDSTRSHGQGPGAPVASPRSGQPRGTEWLCTSIVDCRATEVTHLSVPCRARECPADLPLGVLGPSLPLDCGP